MAQLANVRKTTTRREPRRIDRYAASSPTGEPQITQIGLSVVSATSTRSWASRSLIGGTRR